jgi:hypothetical protein
MNILSPQGKRQAVFHLWSSYALPSRIARGKALHAPPIRKSGDEAPETHRLFPQGYEKAPQSNGLQGLKMEPANGLEPLTY